MVKAGCIAARLSILALLGTVLTAEQAQQKQSGARVGQNQTATNPSVRQRKLSFKVPAGKHGRLVASGARGEKHAGPTLFGAIAPPDTETHIPSAEPCATRWPALYWYTSDAIQKRVDLVILSRDTGVTLREVQLGSSFEPGLHRVQLDQLMTGTPRSGRYVWSVAIVYDEKARAMDRIAWSGFEIQPATANRDVSCWYEEFDEVELAIASGSPDASLLERRHALLAAIDLGPHLQ